MLSVHSTLVRMSFLAEVIQEMAGGVFERCPVCGCGVLGEDASQAVLSRTTGNYEKFCLKCNTIVRLMLSRGRGKKNLMLEIDTNNLHSVRVFPNHVIAEVGEDFQFEGGVYESTGGILAAEGEV